MMMEVDCTGLEPVTSALSKQRSEPTELAVHLTYRILIQETEVKKNRSKNRRYEILSV